VRGPARRITQLGIQHGFLTRLAVDHPGARDPIGPVGYRLDDSMTVGGSHILDGADSSPDMGLQKWSAGLIEDQRCRVGKFAQTHIPADPEIHTRLLIV
jgi:hypothetical protein